MEAYGSRSRVARNRGSSRELAEGCREPWRSSPELAEGCREPGRSSGELPEGSEQAKKGIERFVAASSTSSPEEASDETR